MVRTLRLALVALIGIAVVCAHGSAQQALQLGTARALAPGIDLYHLDDPQLLSPPGPVSAWLLKLDPARIDLRSALAQDQIVGTETVDGIARRHAALAAINAGFFLPTGDPAGLLKLSGTLVSDTARARGAVGILRKPTGVGLVFGQVRASASVSTRWGLTKIDAVDTERGPRRLVLYTPEYHAATRTSDGGVEWILDGTPLAVREVVRGTGSSSIPRTGYVLSYGGPDLPASLARLRRGVRVSLPVTYVPQHAPVRPWRDARDIVGGAGLLARSGEYLAEWDVERLSKGFAETRHPRTMIGASGDGTIWMVVVDGRQPTLSLGMNFAELQALARSLSLRDVLNLDGGGSTTMWVQGTVVNSPSDPTGPRKVSDALLVYSRP